MPPRRCLTVSDVAPAGSVKLSSEADELTDDLGPAEKMAVELMQEYCLTGDLARRVPLPPKALGSLLYALHEAGVLEIAPALKVASP